MYNKKLLLSILKNAAEKKEPKLPAKDLEDSNSFMKKGGSLTANLQGTNRLFKKNSLFKKNPLLKKNSLFKKKNYKSKTYSPNAKLYAEGGEPCPEGMIFNEVIKECITADEHQKFLIDWYQNRKMPDQVDQENFLKVQPEILSRINNFPPYILSEDLDQGTAGYYDDEEKIIALNKFLPESIQEGSKVHENNHYLTSGPKTIKNFAGPHEYVVEQNIRKPKEINTGNPEWDKNLKNNYEDLVFPDEIQSRLMTFRRLAGFKPDQVITEKDVEDYFKSAGDKLDPDIQDIKQVTKDTKAVVNLLNGIVSTPAKSKDLQYAENGGITTQEEIDAANTAMMKARLAYANEFGNPAAKRMINIPDNPYQFDNGDTGTHYMASMDNYAVPQIQDKNGVLQLGDYGPESNEAIRFDSDEDANYFAENYKDVSPGFINEKKKGGALDKFVAGGDPCPPCPDGTVPTRTEAGDCPCPNNTPYRDVTGKPLKVLPKSGTIYVTDLNDPKLLEYKKRQELYDMSKKQYSKILKANDAVIRYTQDKIKEYQDLLKQPGLTQKEKANTIYLINADNIYLANYKKAQALTYDDWLKSAPKLNKNNIKGFAQYNTYDQKNIYNKGVKQYNIYPEYTTSGGESSDRALLYSKPSLTYVFADPKKYTWNEPIKKVEIPPIVEEEPIEEELIPMPVKVPELIDIPTGAIIGQSEQLLAPEYSPNYPKNRIGYDKYNWNGGKQVGMGVKWTLPKREKNSGGFYKKYSNEIKELQKYMEGYDDENGNHIPGEIEKAEQEGRKINFEGHSSIKDKKAQEIYNKEYDEYENLKKWQNYSNGMLYLNKKEYGGLHRFVDGGSHDCPDGYEKDYLGINCIPMTIPEQVNDEAWYKNWYANRTIQDEEGQELLETARPKILKRAENFPEIESYSDPFTLDLGTFEPLTGKIILNDAYLNNNPFRRNEVLFHEKGHYLTSPSLVDPETDTPEKVDAHPIQQLRNYEAGVVEEALKPRKDVPRKDRKYYDYLKGKGKNKNYTEEISKMLMGARRLGKFQPDQEITDKDIENLYKKAEEKGWLDPSSDFFSEPLYNLKEYTKSPEQIKMLFNKLAKNKSDKGDEYEPQIAEYGGALSKFVGGGEDDKDRKKRKWFKGKTKGMYTSVDDPNFKRYDYLEGLNMTAEEFSEKYPNYSSSALYFPEVTVTSKLSEEGQRLYDQAYKSVQNFNSKVAGANWNNNTNGIYDGPNIEERGDMFRAGIEEAVFKQSIAPRIRIIDNAIQNATPVMDNGTGSNKQKLYTSKYLKKVEAEYEKWKNAPQGDDSQPANSAYWSPGKLKSSFSVDANGNGTWTPGYGPRRAPASAANNYNDGPLQGFHPEVLAMAPAGSMAAAIETLGSFGTSLLGESLTTALPLGEAITTATAGSLTPLNIAMPYFAADAIVNQFPEAISHANKGEYSDATEKAIYGTLGLTGLGLGKGMISGVKNLGKALSTESGLLSNTSKINPWAGTFEGESLLPKGLQFNKLDNPEAFYRLTKDPKNYGLNIDTYFNKGVPLTGDLANTFPKGSRAWGHRYSGPKFNPVTKKIDKFNGADYLFKVEDESLMKPFIDFPEEHLKFYQQAKEINPGSAQFFKKDWLKGWKEVPLELPGSPNSFSFADDVGKLGDYQRILDKGLDIHDVRLKYHNNMVLNFDEYSMIHKFGKGNKANYERALVEDISGKMHTDDLIPKTTGKISGEGLINSIRGTEQSKVIIPNKNISFNESSNSLSPALFIEPEKNIINKKFELPSFYSGPYERTSTSRASDKWLEDWFTNPVTKQKFIDYGGTEKEWKDIINSLENPIKSNYKWGKNQPGGVYIRPFDQASIPLDAGVDIGVHEGIHKAKLLLDKNNPILHRLWNDLVDAVRLTPSEAYPEIFRFRQKLGLKPGQTIDLKTMEDNLHLISDGYSMTYKIKDKNKLLEIINNAPAVLPAAIGLGAASQIQEKEYGGALNKFVGGGETPSSVWRQYTGTAWSEAKKQGLTDGSAKENLALRDRLLAGEFGEAKVSNEEVAARNDAYKNMVVRMISKGATLEELVTKRIGTKQGLTNMFSELSTPVKEDLSRYAAQIRPRGIPLPKVFPKEIEKKIETIVKEDLKKYAATIAPKGIPLPKVFPKQIEKSKPIVVPKLKPEILVAPTNDVASWIKNEQRPGPNMFKQSIAPVVPKAKSKPKENNSKNFEKNLLNRLTTLAQQRTLLKPEPINKVEPIPNSMAAQFSKQNFNKKSYDNTGKEVQHVLWDPDHTSGVDPAYKTRLAAEKTRLAAEKAFTPIFDNSIGDKSVDQELYGRQKQDNERYGKFMNRGKDIANRTDVQRNIDSEQFFADIAKPNSVIIDIGSALGNSNSKLAGVSVWELTQNPKIKQKKIKVIATDIPDQVKSFKEHIKNKKAYNIDYAEVPMTFNTPIYDVLKTKNLGNTKDVYLRAANSIDLLMTVAETKEHFYNIAKSLKDKNVTYVYNNMIWYKSADSTSWSKIGNINNAAFDHKAASWTTNKNRKPYTLIPN
jgi:hypothetical protein